MNWRMALLVLMLMGCSSKLDRQLVLAASEGNLSQVRELLDRGANVSYRLADNGTTALIVAASNGHLSIVEVLLAAGADINAVDYDAGGALYWAAFNGQIGVMRFLIGRGAKLNCSSDAAKYLLKIMRDRDFHEAEALVRSQLRREKIPI